MFKVVSRPAVTNEQIADIWEAVALVRGDRGDRDGSIRAFRASDSVREGIREAEGLRAHNALALRRGDW